MRAATILASLAIAAVPAAGALASGTPSATAVAGAVHSSRPAAAAVRPAAGPVAGSVARKCRYVNRRGWYCWIVLPARGR